MLIVSRRPGQSILIGKEIEVFVLEVDGVQVRVGINAPKSIRILRQELLTIPGNQDFIAGGADSVRLLRALPSLEESRPGEELVPNSKTPPPPAS